ncbi:MAG TPA: site-specific DNA-methyltransferase [Dehalococcoidia bacterium]|nr:site-specific DNA-methyltransferase [Dehalococcoidia bacterium]
MKAASPRRNHLYEGDCLELMATWPSATFDHCIADPPFGITRGKGRGSKKGLGWAFSSHVTIDESWDAADGDFAEFNRRWLREVCRLVKPNGNILVFGTYHNVYQLGQVLSETLGRRINNSIIWFKPNAQPNITARVLTESTEQIIWAVNGTATEAASPDGLPSQPAKGWIFNYQVAKELAGGKQMRNLWEFAVTPRAERIETGNGVHPTQKPLALLERLVRVMTNEEDWILDPFGGAGTLAIAAGRNKRSWTLIESSSEYAAAAAKRIAAEV